MAQRFFRPVDREFLREYNIPFMPRANRAKIRR